MLEVIVPYINSKIEALDMFQKLYGLCETLTSDGKSYPAEYCNNEYTKVEIDKYKGIVYHRLTGEISTEELPEEETVSCSPFYSRTFPFRSVFIIKKEFLKNIGNDAYLESKIGNTLASNIATSNNKQLRIDLGADSVSIELNNIILNRNEIFESEYSGVDNFFRYEYLYVAIDYSIIITGNVSCIINYNCESNVPVESGDFSSDFSSDFS